MTWSRIPGAYLPGYERLTGFGAPVAGCVLLAASVFPSRWRARPPAPEAPPPPQPEEEAPAPPPLPKRIPSRY